VSRSDPSPAMQCQGLRTSFFIPVHLFLKNDFKSKSFNDFQIAIKTNIEYIYWYILKKSSFKFIYDKIFLQISLIKSNAL